MVEKRLWKKRISILLIVLSLVMQILTPVVTLAIGDISGYSEDVISIISVEGFGDDIEIQGMAMGNPENQLFLGINENLDLVEISESGSFTIRKPLSEFQSIERVYFRFGTAFVDLSEQINILIKNYNLPEDKLEKPTEESEKIIVKKELEEKLLLESQGDISEDFVPENLDHLDRPIEVEGSGLFYLPESSMPRLKTARSIPFRGEESPENPGDVSLSKTVEEVSGLVNTFEVTLRIEALDAVESNDIVLVIDTSGSMEGSRMTNAKIAAGQFVEQLLTESHSKTRIALVTFGTDVTQRTTFLNYEGKETLKTAINNLNANGGTHTQGGMHMALTLLGGTDADVKQIVLLSDGEPTYSYKMYDPDSYLIPYSGGDKQTGTGSPESNYNYNSTIGNGSSLRWRYYRGWIFPDKYYNNGNSAIAEAGFAKDSGYTVHTIALGAGTTGTSILNSMASPGKSYSTTDPTELEDIFENIASDILSAMRNASVNDLMGTGFHVTGGYATDLEPSQGTASYDSDERKILWNIGNLTKPTPETDDDPNLKYAELKYQVEINDDILGVVSPDGSYNTNANASVTYTDYEGNEKIVEFPIPTAVPLIIEMEKKLLDARGNVIPNEYSNDRKFNLNMVLEEDETYNKDYLISGNKSRVMTDIRIDKTYTLTENKISGDPNSSFDDYKTTINWKTYDESQGGTLVEGTTYQGFKIPRNDDDEPLNTRFTVINQEKPLGRLTIEKKVNNMLERSRRDRAAAPVFKVEVVGKNIYNPEEEIYRKIFDLTTAEPIVLEKLQYGEYTISETESNGLTSSYEDSEGVSTDGMVKISINEKEQSVTITNTPDADAAYVDVTAKKVWVGGNEADHIAVKLDLYQDGIPYTDKDYAVLPATGTADEFTYTWTDLPKYNKSGGIAEYTVKEPNPNSFYIVTYEKDNVIKNTYNDNLNPIEVTAYKNWVGGDVNNRPDIWFTLFRKVGAVLEEKVTVDADGNTIASTKKVIENTVTWENMSKQIGADIGQTYTYFVKETKADGTDLIPVNYEKEENGLTVKNTYKSPLTKELIGIKEWVNGPTDKPTVQLELWRKGGTAGVGEKVKDSIVEIIAPNTTANFGPQDKTDNDGVEYTYFVKEVGEDNGIITLGGLKYNVEYDGLTVKNTYNPPLSDIEATKTWEGGPITKPDIGFKLYRQIENGEVDAVSGATIYQLTSGNTNAKWKNIPTTDDKGNPYTFSVKEVDKEGNEFEPENYKKAENGLNIINTYSSPIIDKLTATKIWVDGGESKPIVWFSLYRKVGTGEEEAVTIVPEGDGEPVPVIVKLETPTGEIKVSYTWSKKFPLTDEDGEEYTYFVYETDANGDKAWKPENYEKKENGLEVTNYYNSPVIEEFTVTKKWSGDDKVTRPEMEFTLYRTIDKTQEGDIASLEKKRVDGENTTATWKKIVDTDEQERPYYYYVKEKFVEDKPSNANWKLGEYNFEDNSITNTVVTGEEKSGELQIEKVLKNELDTRKMSTRAEGSLEFTVVVKDEYKNETSVKIKAGETKTIENLYYGKYTIEETVTPGYTPSYEPETVTVIKGGEIPKFVVTNTKTGGDETTVKIITSKKEWLGDKNWDNKEYAKPDIWFKLQRKTSNGAWEDVSNSIKQVQDSNEVSWIVPIGNSEYRVKEVDQFGNDFVPKGFTKVEDGMTVKNYKITPPQPTPTPIPSDPTWILWSVAPKLNKNDHFGYMIGYPNGEFKPENTITRGEMTAIFARLLEEKIILTKDYPLEFSDVSRDDWYAEYIGMLTQLGVISGYPDGTFKPNNPVTRAEFATVASRFIQTKRTGFGGFADVKSDYWARESIDAVLAEGWIKGYPDGSFKPERELTRGETVTIVNRMLDRFADKIYVDKNLWGLVNFVDLDKSHWAFYDIMEACNSHDYIRNSDRSETWTDHWRPY